MNIGVNVSGFLRPTRHVCQACEHPLTDHAMGWGRCSGQSQDPDYGTYNCVCPHAEIDDTEQGDQ
jgi:hypothetical protein